MNNPGEERQGRRPFIREKDNEKSLKGWWWWASRERHEYLPVNMKECQKQGWWTVAVSTRQSRKYGSGSHSRYVACIALDNKDIDNFISCKVCHIFS
jgi:hypothetical protein